jgi:F0F1-type ATP synthase assembly protein I
MDNVQKLLLLNIFFVLIAFALFHIYTPILFVILFMGFLKIVLHNPVFENAREKFERLF